MSKKDSVRIVLNAKGLPQRLMDMFEAHWDDSNLRFKPGVQSAYCKYCHRTHTYWVLSWSHFDPMAWECALCHHHTADEYMQIKE